MICKKCEMCHWWAQGVRFKRAIELCSQKDVFMGRSDSCDEWRSNVPGFQRAIEDLSGPRGRG